MGRRIGQNGVRCLTGMRAFVLALALLPGVTYGEDLPVLTGQGAYGDWTKDAP